MEVEQLAVEGGTPVRTRPFPDWPIHGDAELEAVEGVVRSGDWGSTTGNEVNQFESEFAAFQGARHAVAVVNGTVALTVALRACGIGPGDEVLVPAYTFIASATSVLLAGAVPVIIDVLPDSLLMDPGQLEPALTSRTKAIMPVHLGGRVCDLDAIGAVAKDHGLRVIEDAAQAVGAAWQGRGVGSLGDMGGMSFQSSKSLTAGEGGIVLTDSDDLSEAAWSTRNVGRSRQGGWYEHPQVGWNFRMTEFQGALLRVQLGRLPDQLERRTQNLEMLEAGVAALPGLTALTRDPRMTRPGAGGFSFRLGGRLRELGKQRFVAALCAEGIPAGTGYDTPLNQSRPLQDDVAVRRPEGGVPTPACPVAEAAVQDTVTLPQPVLLGGPEDTHDVLRALEKVSRSLALA